MKRIFFSPDLAEDSIARNVTPEPLSRAQRRALLDRLERINNRTIARLGRMAALDATVTELVAS